VVSKVATFGEVLDSLAGDGNHWSALIPRSWANGRTVFGGLQVALGVRAMRGALTVALGEGNGGVVALPLRSLQTTFVAPVAAGVPVTLRAEFLRAGRSATHARCDLLQDGKVACTTVAIFGAARASRIALDIPKPEIQADPESLPDMPYIPGITPEFLQQLQLRWGVGRLPYSGHDDPHSTIFARLRDAGCSAEDTLIALADSIPTPALSMLDKPAPATSINWMLELIGDPGQLDRDGWSLIGTDVRAGADGYLSQTSVLWGPGGHAFSVSHQSVAIFG
jgi:acyl-CoA thioesterase